MIRPVPGEIITPDDWEIDADHPLRPAFAWVAAVQPDSDLVAGVPVPLVGGESAGSFGPCRTYDGATQIARVATPVVSGYPVTIGVWCSTPGSAVASTALALASSGSAQPYVAVGRTAGNLPFYQIRNSTGLVIANLTGATSMANGRAHWLAGTSSGAAAHAVYVNGALIATDSTDLAEWPPVNQASIGGLYRPTPVSYWVGGIALAAVWGRALSAAEHAELARHPLGILRRRRTWLWMGGAGATAYDLAVARADAAATAASIAIAADWAVTPARADSAPTAAGITLAANWAAAVARADSTPTVGAIEIVAAYGLTVAAALSTPTASEASLTAQFRAVVARSDSVPRAESIRLGGALPVRRGRPSAYLATPRRHAHRATPLRSAILSRTANG